MSSTKQKLSKTKPECFEKSYYTPNVTPLLVAMMVLFFVFIARNASSQTNDTIYPKTVVINKDTVTIFNQNQTLELTKRNEQRKECLETNAVIEKQLIERDSTINNFKSVVLNQEKTEKNYQGIIKQKNDLNAICEQEKESLEKEVKKEKRKKIFAITGGALGTGIMGTLWLTKK